MTNLRRLLLGGLSHGAVLLAGWVALGVFRRPVENDGAAPGATEEAGRGAVAEGERKAGERRGTKPGLSKAEIEGQRREKDEEESAASGNRRAVLSQALKRADREAESGGGAGQAEVAAGSMPAELEARLAELKKAGENGDEAQLGMAVYGWAVQDVAGFQQWRGGSGPDPDQRDLLRWWLMISLEVMAERLPVEQAVEIALHAPELIDDSLMGVWAKRLLAGKPDLARLEQLQEAMGPKHWPEFAESLARQWPVESRSLLVRWAVGQRNAGLLVQQISKERGDGEWLAAVLADPALPEDFRGTLAANEEVGEALVAAPGLLTLEQRLTATRASQPDAEEDDLPGSLCYDDVAWEISHHVDWPYLVRCGEVTAEQALAEIERSTPALAAAYPQPFRRAVFSELALDAPAQAVTLLGTERSEEDRRAAILETGLRDDTLPDDPQKLLELLRQAPGAEMEEAETREKIWNHVGGHFSSDLGESYLQWVEALPPGLDRDLALARAAADAERRTESERMRQKISNPRLRAGGRFGE